MNTQSGPDIPCSPGAESELYWSGKRRVSKRQTRWVVRLHLGVLSPLILLTFLSSPVRSGNRLAVPMVGSWDFDFVALRVNPPRPTVGQGVTIEIVIACQESSDRTGQVRVAIQLQKDWRVVHQASRETNIAPAGTRRKVTFRYRPSKPGVYRIDSTGMKGADVSISTQQWFRLGR